MKERGIIFNTEMVRAIIDGRKKQARYVAKFKPIDKEINLNYSGLKSGNYHEGINDGQFVLRSIDGGCWVDRTHPLSCPYGKIGDRLWVRETFNGFWLDDDVIQEIKEGISSASELCDYKADYPDDSKPLEGWTPSAQMPRWASRITLEITDIRVGRPSSITEEDAMAEGAIPPDGFSARGRHPFKVWESIYSHNGYGIWQENPWMWVITFKKVE
ncbi:TPA: hypothetical protein U2M19_001864 [Providencia rettgeri]|nr:hypothetical protein [Providencia rettgeri]